LIATQLIKKYSGGHEEFFLQGYKALLATCFQAGFMLNLFFDPEEGGDMFLRNIG
jgi:hypothetical protein